MEWDLQLDSERLRIILKPRLPDNIRRLRELAFRLALSSISRAETKRDVRRCSFGKFSALSRVDLGRAEDGQKSCAREASALDVFHGEPLGSTLNSARGSGTAPARSSTYRHNQGRTETETTF